MVTRSVVDYARHKADVYQVIGDKYGPERATKFVNFYANRYDVFGRSFIDYRLAFWLMDDYHHVDRIGTRWYACVGVGGTGKTTLLKNVFYFLDPTFDMHRLTTDTFEFVKRLKEFETVGSMKACLMDEPDDLMSSNSKAGKMLRRILGKARQQKMFFGVCATDLKDIPPYIFRKLDGIFFTPYLGKYMFFKNRPRQASYVLQQIRKDYSDKGYKVFFELRKEKGCLAGDTQKLSPFDLTQEQEYLDMKKKDYETDIEQFLKMGKEGEPKERERDIIIQNMRKQGLTHREISKLVGLTRGRVSQILGDSAKVKS